MRSASTAAFRILFAATLGAAVLLDMTLAHARTTRMMPVKPSTDCNAPAPAPPQPTQPSTSAEPAPPPGIFAAFGSCGEPAHPSSSR